MGNQRSGSVPSLFTFILRSVPVPIFGKNSGSIHIRVKLCSVGWIVQRGCSGLKTSNSNLVQLLFTFGHCLVDASGNQILKFKPCSVSVHIQTLFSFCSHSKFVQPDFKSNLVQSFLFLHMYFIGSKDPHTSKLPRKPVVLPSFRLTPTTRRTSRRPPVRS